MRLEFSFRSEKPLELPFHYHTILQGFVYNIIKNKQILDFIMMKDISLRKDNSNHLLFHI